MTNSSKKSRITDEEFNPNNKELQYLRDEVNNLKNQNDLFFDNSPYMIYEIDFRGPKLLRVNDALCKKMGYTREEFLSKNPMDFLDEKSKKLFQDRIKKFQSGKEPANWIEYTAYSKNGETLIGEFHITFTYEDGKPKGALVVVHDITKLKNAEKALKEINDNLELKVHKRTVELYAEHQRLFDLLETIPITINILTEDYRIIFANKAFRDEYGEQKSEYKGIHCYEYCFGKSEPCSFCEAFQVFETGKPHDWEVNAPDGSIIECHDYPFKDLDGSDLILEMSFDVTEQRQAQEALKNINENLEVMVEKRTKSLQNSQSQFEALLQNLNAGVALINETGEFELVNKSFMKMFGLKDDTDILNINSLDWRQWKVYGEDHELLPVDEHPVRNAAITGKPVKNQLVSVQNPGENKLTWMMVPNVL